MDEWDVTRIFMSSLSVLAHVLTLYTIYTNRVFKTPIYVYISNIAINDILILLCMTAKTLTRPVFTTLQGFCILAHTITTLQVSIRILFIIISFKDPVRKESYTQFIITVLITTFLSVATGTIAIFAIDFEYELLLPSLGLVNPISFLLLCLFHLTCRCVYQKEGKEHALQLNLGSVYVACNLLPFLLTIIVYATENFYDTLNLAAVSAQYYGFVNILAFASFDKLFRFGLLQALQCHKTKDSNAALQGNEETQDEGIPLQAINIS